MPLPRRTKDITSIKEAHRDLYTLKKVKENGVDVEIHVLTDIENHDDVEINRTLRSEAAANRTKYAAIDAKLASLPEGFDAEKAAQLIADNEALKAEKEAAGGKDQKAIDKAVEARLNAATAPLQLKVKQYETEVGTLKTENEKFKTSAVERTIDDAAMSAFTKVGVQQHVYTRGKLGDDPDGLSWARRVAHVVDGKVVHKTSGLPLDDVLVQMRDDGDRAHWFGGSSGTGSGNGGLGNERGPSNPWAAESWNPTAQCEIQNKDLPRAKQLASNAGVDVDAPFHPKNGPPKSTFY